MPAGLLQWVGGRALGGWQQLRRLTGSVTPARGFAVRAIDRFDERHDALWARVRGQHRCVVVRDASYLNWKYVRQPGQEFVRLQVEHRGEVVGVVVFTLLAPDAVYPYSRALVVDYVAPLHEHDTPLVVLEALRSAAREHGAALVVFDVMGASLRARLTQYGYLRREPTRFLLVSTGAGPGDVEEELLSPSAWFVTRGDSDIDRPIQAATRGES
jgi:hypothetical protein